MITGPVRSVKLARKLRSEMSLPEVILWRALRTRPDGFKFRRQHPAGVYVLDFYCAAVRLAIEVDGAAHDGDEAVRRDEARSHFLRSQHVATLRIPAQSVLGQLESVVTRITQVCAERAEKLAMERVVTLHHASAVPLHHPSHGPPPRAGEEA